MLGVLLGEATGIVAVDHDGDAADDVLMDLLGTTELPTTATITSGKPGRYCSFFTVPPERWATIEHRSISTGKVGPDGKEEKLELRWKGQQVVAGIHPETQAPYKWLRHPSEVGLAQCPEQLLQAMAPEVKRSRGTLPQLPLPTQASDEAVPLEKLIARECRDWIDGGVAAGGRDNAGAKLARDLIGAETWARQNGVRLDGNARDLLGLFCERCQPPLSDRDEERIFRSAEQSGPSPSLSDDKLLVCVQKFQQRQRQDQRKPPAGNDGTPATTPTPDVDSGEWFQCLGFNKSEYYYLPRGQKQVITITAAGHSDKRLLTLAPREFWLQQYPKPGRDLAIDWTWAISDLYAVQHSAGVSDPRRVRGRGTWIDDGRVIIHLGERLISNGQQVQVGKLESRFIYEQGARIPGPDLNEPMDEAEARELLVTASLCRWEHPASAAMLAGWVALAPVCGSLRWRPHCWVVGGAGSGKSTVLSDFVKPLLGEMETSVLGASTEAGLRQHLSSDAIPVLMDEAEQAQARDEERLQSVMELARASSSETGAKTLKGTASGTGQEYLIRSMFLLSSITSSLKQGSDKSRFALLQLANPANDTAEDMVAHEARWQKLRERLARISAGTGRRLIARTVKRLPILLRECELFSDVAAEFFGSRRAGDQFGFLMAGAWSLTNDREATHEDAVAFIGRHNWDEFLEPARAATDHERCLNRIMEHRVRVAVAENDIPLGELLEIYHGKDQEIANPIDKKTADKILQRFGIKSKNGRLIISANHTAIGKILEKSPWSNDWRTVLKQIPGAELTESTYFRGGHQSRAISVPLPSFDRD